jgi:prepilin-type N-terminal cleavage/methylation domain-containing protein
MKNSKSQECKGFTIIEVVLVLAIAGLIFLMVFIAIPTLQRNQRDTQRRNIMDRVAAQVQSYMGNNNGAIPSDWNSFRANYMLVGTDDFVDPDGRPLVFEMGGAVTAGTGNPGAATVSRDSAAVAAVGTEGQPGYAPAVPADTGVPIIVYLSAQCDGENAVPAGTGATRRVAFRIKLEGAGTYCVDNA